MNIHRLRPAGCSESPSSKAAASEEAEAYSLPYVEPLSDARTPLADFINSLLDTLQTAMLWWVSCGLRERL